MKTVLSAKRHHYVAGAGIFLITVALVAGMASCAPAQYNLTVSSTEGGEVTSPGEGTFDYDEGTDVDLVTEAEEGYQFVNWTGDVGTISDVNAAITTITMNGNYEITANFEAIPPIQYNLTISSTAGGSVTTPGEGTFTYDEGTVINLVATPDAGYRFVNWTGDVGTIANVSAAITTITMNAHYSITADFAIEIWNWYDLHAVRDNLNGSYILMNNLDSTTAGYAEVASRVANQGKGWQPIGSLYPGPAYWDILEFIDPFAGSFDGQGYEIRDLFVDRPDEHGVGLFGFADEGGIVENLGVVNAEVTGHVYVGGLVGYNLGTVSSSYSTGSVTGEHRVGGLVGYVHDGTVSNSYSTGSVTGHGDVGGLVGTNDGTVSNSYSTASVTGEHSVGGLVGINDWGTVNNSYYNHDEVLINGRKMITIGALFDEDFGQWLANDKFLDVNERLSEEDGYYLIDDVRDFKQLLAFGQDGSLKFRLKNDLDLATEPNFYIPYLAGEFDGNGHKIWNLSFRFHFVSNVGLFGYLAFGGKVGEVGVESVNITGGAYVGGLVGGSGGTVHNCYSEGSVTGGTEVGGLVGFNTRIVSNSYSGGTVTGDYTVGGLVGWNYCGTVSNSYYNYDEVLINGENIITIGALFGEDFEQWLANDKFLDVNERLSQENGYYVINNVSDFKQLLAFGQDGSLKFRLKNDLDLATEPNFYIPHLAGEFDGNGHKIRNLSFRFDFVSQVGLFGLLAHGGKVSQVGVESVDITGSAYVGALVGGNRGTVSNSYSAGSVTGGGIIGGLVGANCGTVSNSYSGGSVTSSHGPVGGLVGWNDQGAVSNSYSTGSVTGVHYVGGLVGNNSGTVRNSYAAGSVSGEYDVGGLVGTHYEGTVISSFWDTQTSGQSTSSGGTGKTTAEMQSIATLTGAAWDITAVAPGATNPAYIWNIVNGQTYPFLSWQSVS